MEVTRGNRLSDYVYRASEEKYDYVVYRNQSKTATNTRRNRLSNDVYRTSEEKYDYAIYRNQSKTATNLQISEFPEQPRVVGGRKVVADGC